MVGRKKILPVDHAGAILMMEKMVLNKGGFDPVSAEDARKWSQRQRRDLTVILMDVMMLRMKGVKDRQQLRQNKAAPSIPIIENIHLLCGVGFLIMAVSPPMPGPHRL